nr:MAG TPA: hypothetical protein [Caudoviricetes sp.]
MKSLLFGLVPQVQLLQEIAILQFLKKVLSTLRKVILADGLLRVDLFLAITIKLVWLVLVLMYFGLVQIPVILVILQILARVVPTFMLLMAENSLVRTQKCVVTLPQIDLNVIMAKLADGLLVVVLCGAEALIYILVAESFVMTLTVMVVILVDGRLEKIQFLLVALFYKVMVTFILG